jgi:hypothetical protein
LAGSESVAFLEKAPQKSFSIFFLRRWIDFLPKNQISFWGVQAASPFFKEARS